MTNAEIQAVRAKVEKEVTIAFGKCFNSPEGRKVLDFLNKLTLDRPTWDYREGENFGYYREGQNTLFKHIISRVRAAKRIK